MPSLREGMAPLRMTGVGLVADESHALSEVLRQPKPKSIAAEEPRPLDPWTAGADVPRDRSLVSALEGRAERLRNALGRARERARVRLERGRSREHRSREGGWSGRAACLCQGR